jgi:hypothetical protein
MPQLIDIPGLGTVEFPDGMTDDQIGKAIQRDSMYREKDQAAIAGDRAMAVAGAIGAVEPFVEPVAHPISNVAKTLGGGLNAAGRVAKGLAVDVMRGRVLPEPGQIMPNLEATGAALENQEPSTEGLTPVQKGLAGAAASLPMVVAGTVAQAMGIPAALAFGTPMAAQTYEQTESPRAAAMSGVTGALIPGVGQLARGATAKAMAGLVERGAVPAGATAVQKVAETIGDQAGMQGFIHGMSLPEYWAMPPDQRRDAIVENSAAFLAFMVPQLARVASGAPSGTQAELAKRPEFVVADAMNRIVNDPAALDALRVKVDDVVFDALNPANAAEQAAAIEPAKPPGTRVTFETPPTTVDKPTVSSVSVAFGPEQPKPNSTWKASTPTEGNQVSGQWEAVDADKLVTSFDPAFNPELQPRDRRRAASQNQIAEIVLKFEPQRLGESPTTDMGAPIVDELDQVLSGNGRVTALRTIYGSENPARADDYRHWLMQNASEFGLDPEAIAGMRQPVLVRRVTDYGKLNKVGLTEESNRQQILGMGDAEKASSDAKLLLNNPALLDQFLPSESGNLLAASNRPFLNEFIRSTGAGAELLGKEGYNAPSLARRVKNAILGAMVGPENRTLLDAMIERGDELNIKNAVTGLMTAAPRLVKFKGGPWDISSSLAQAMKDLVQMRSEGQKLQDFLDQRSLFGETGRTFESDYLLSKLHEGRSIKSIAEPLARYAELASKVDVTTGDMFGATLPSRKALLEIAYGKGKAEGSGEAQADIPLGKPAKRSQEPNGPPRPAAPSLRGGTEDAAALAKVEQATLPRQIEAPASMPTQPGEPISLASIREYLSEALDIPVRLGVKIPGGIRAALGFFRPQQETIRLKSINDIPTLAHEVGHYFHFILFPRSGNRIAASAFAGQFDAELMALGARTSKASYTPHQVRMEGVAEFMSDYLVDRSRALAAAPAFTKFFESELPNKFPEIWKVVTKARGDIAAYIKQPGKLKVLSMISMQLEDKALPLSERWRKFYDNWVSELAPIDRTMAYLRGLGLKEAPGKAVLDLATNYVGGWRGKVEQSLFRAQIDYDGNVVGPSFQSILDGCESLDDFRAYAVSKHALDLAARGKESGIDLPSAKQLVIDLAPRYEAMRQKLAKFQHNELLILRDAGFTTNADIARMEAANPHYLPFHRVYEGLGAGGRGGGRGFIDLPRPLRMFKGGSQQIVDPLESIVKNMYLYRDIVERNRIGRAFIDAVESVRGGGRVAESVAKRVKPVKVTGAEVKEYLKQMGLDKVEGVDDFLQSADKDLGFKIWRSARTASAQEGIFSVWKNGEERFYHLDDPNLFRALKLSDSSTASMLSQLSFLKPFASVTRFVRAGATLTIEFIARNPFKDSVTAGVFSRYGFVPFWDGFRGILSAVKRDDLYWDWVRSGGRYSDFIAMDRADLQRKMIDVIGPQGARDFLVKWGNPLATLQKASELMEQATRLSEFRRAKMAGASDVEAANASKDVTLNFTRFGYLGKLVNQLAAFFNAGVQDVDKIARAHAEAPLRTVSKAFLYITVPSLMAWYLGKDDKEIQNLPEWRKNTCWNINVRKIAAQAGLASQGDWIMSLPKPFLLGALYGNSFERGLDYAYGKDPNAVKKFLGAVLDQMPVSLDLAQDFGKVTIARPFVEAWANRSLFRGTPLENQSQQRLPATERATPQTSQTAVQLARAIQILTGGQVQFSPIKLDNTVQGLFAGIGRYGLDAADWTIARIGLIDVPVRPTKSLSEWPAIKGFAPSPYTASVYVDRFYNAAQLAEQRIASFRNSAVTMQTGVDKRWWDKNSQGFAWYMSRGTSGDPRITELRRAMDNLSDLTKASVQVQQSRTLSADEKRVRLLKLNESKNKLAEAYFKTLIPPGDQRAVY